jgi:hypothetical protein
MKTTNAMLVAVAGLASVACGQVAPGEPVWVRSGEDSVTAGGSYRNVANQLRWGVEAGADQYAWERYERPVAQEFLFEGGRYGAKEYYEYVDIERASYGYDGQFLYAAIDVVGFDKLTEDGARSPIGLMSKYALKFSNNPDGRFGHMLMVEQPGVQSSISTVWSPIGVFVYLDTNGDVGGAASSGPTGLTVSKSVNGEEEQGLNGYDSVVASDGRINSLTIGWARISPTNPTEIQMALRYAPLGLTLADVSTLAYVDADAMEGLADPQTMHRNDKFSAEEAGSPNLGVGGSSEFGTVGLQGVYGIDNLRLVGPGAPVACVADWNNDGGVDGDDVIAFFSDWDRGLADINGDGGTDGDDVIVFFASWDNGC